MLKNKKKTIATVITLVVALMAFGAMMYLGYARTKIGSFKGLSDRYSMYGWSADIGEFTGTLKKAVFPKGDYLAIDVGSTKGEVSITVKCGKVIVFQKEGITEGRFVFPVYGRTVISIHGEGFGGSFNVIQNPELPTGAGNIYLYGEDHGERAIMEGEFEQWKSYYDSGMRDLFIELPYFTGQYLNIWMASDNDDILYELYDDLDGTQVHVEATLDLYKQIKLECPETVFHGIDVGHQHSSTGERYLAYLLSNGYDEKSSEYVTALENMNQGRYYQRNYDNTYRENMMVQNFIREYDGIFGRDIMGIFGGAHTVIDGMEYTTGKIRCMANVLNGYYGGAVSCTSLEYLKYLTEPLSTETIELNGKEYTASYFGVQDISSFTGYQTREVWRIEGAYEDLKNVKTTNNLLTYESYPVQVEIGQVYKIAYTMTDGTVNIEYHRADGDTWRGSEATRQMRI